MIAGADTTANTLAALVFHVLDDASVCEQLRHELITAFPETSQPLEPAKLDGLRYLNVLIEETLRLYPAQHTAKIAWLQTRISCLSIPTTEPPSSQRAQASA